MFIMWKEFNIDLEAILALIEAELPGKCSGLTCGSVGFQVHLHDVTTEQISALKELIEDITEESPEALSYRSESQIQNAKNTLKQGVLNKTWNQMNALERKAAMNLPISKSELIEAGVL